MHYWRKGISWVLKVNLLGASSIDMIDFRPARLVIYGATDNIEETLLTPELGLFHGVPLLRLEISGLATENNVLFRQNCNDTNANCAE